MNGKQQLSLVCNIVAASAVMLGTSVRAQQATPNSAAAARLVAQAQNAQREQRSAEKTAAAAKAAVAQASESASPLRVLPGAVYSAKVDSVVDGQTLVVDARGEKRTVRLWGVTAPLTDVPAGNTNARDFLKQALEGQLVRVEERGSANGVATALVTAEGGLSNQPRTSRPGDVNGVARDLPYVARANPLVPHQDMTRFTSANEAMIRGGFARFDVRASSNNVDGADKLKQAEADAQKDGKGLWAKPDPKSN